MRNYKDVVYILTNPMYAGYVKIGYASDLVQRLATLNTGMLRNFEPFAVYETGRKNADKELHAIIDDLVPILRARVINGEKVQDKEFFKLEPEQAYLILKHIALLTGTETRLHLLKNEEHVDTKDADQSFSAEINRMSKPEHYMIAGVQYPFSTWIESLICHCNVIIQHVGFSTFCQSALLMKTSKRAKRKLFAETEEEMRGFSYYKFTQGNLYLLTNYSGGSIKKINDLLNKNWPQYVLLYESMPKQGDEIHDY